MEVQYFHWPLVCPASFSTLSDYIPHPPSLVDLHGLCSNPAICLPLHTPIWPSWSFTVIHPCPQRLVQKMVHELSRSSKSPTLRFNELELGRVKTKKQTFILCSQSWPGGSLDLPVAMSLPTWGNLISWKRIQHRCKETQHLVTPNNIHAFYTDGEHPIPFCLCKFEMGFWYNQKILTCHNPLSQGQPLHFLQGETEWNWPEGTQILNRQQNCMSITGLPNSICQMPCFVKHKGCLSLQGSESKNMFVRRYAKHTLNDKASGTQQNIGSVQHLTNGQMSLSTELRFQAKVIIITWKI